MIDPTTLDRLTDDGAPVNSTGPVIANHCELCGRLESECECSAAEAEPAGSYCVWCWDRPRRSDGSEPDAGATNALRFATADEAETYARELAGRWFGLDHWEIRFTLDPVTYRWDSDTRRAVSLEAARS